MPTQQVLCGHQVILYMILLVRVLCYQIGLLYGRQMQLPLWAMFRNTRMYTKNIICTIYTDPTSVRSDDGGHVMG